MRLAILLAAAAVAASCAGHTKSDVARVKREIEWAKTEAANSQKANEPLARYVEQLESGKLSPGYYLMISGDDIVKYGTQAFIPYQLPANSIHKKITGTFTTKKIVDVEVKPGNAFKMTLLLQGKDIKVNYKGDLYKPHVKKIKAGLEKGLSVDLEVSLSLSKKGTIKAKVRCSGTKLLANNEAMYTNNIEAAINKAMSKEKYDIGLPPKGVLKPAELFTTRNHVVVVYR
jgi:hypothetical protein